MLYSSKENDIIDGYIPGISLTHKIVKKIMRFQDDQNQKEIQLNTDDLKIIAENFDDYLMYIWMHLGDTRFNREGYREATDILQKKIT